MAKRQLPGGTSIFPVQTRPSIFNPLPPEEMVERHGEPAIWIRQIPTLTTTPGRLAVPDAADANSKGFINSIQRSYEISDESIQIQAVRGDRIYPAFTPIDRIRRLYVLRADLQGGNFDIPIIEVQREYFRIRKPEGWKYWHLMVLDYDILMYEVREQVIEQAVDGAILTPPLVFPEIITKLHEVWVEKNGAWIMFNSLTVRHDFATIHLPEPYPAGTKYRIKYDAYQTIPVGYRTADQRITYLNNIQLMTGDLDAIFAPYYHLTEGDILILPNSRNVGKEIAVRGTDGRYRLKYGPITEISGVMTSGGELNPSQFRQTDHYHFTVTVRDKNGLPPERVGVVYTFAPCYRLEHRITYSSLNNRVQPKKFILRPDFSNVILNI